MSLRFNLDKEEERRAWENLQSANTSRNRTAILAINSYFEHDAAIADVIRQTIKECLDGVAFEPAVPVLELSAEENELLNLLDDFLG